MTLRLKHTPPYTVVLTLSLLPLAKDSVEYTMRVCSLVVFCTLYPNLNGESQRRRRENEREMTCMYDY